MPARGQFRRYRYRVDGITLLRVHASASFDAPSRFWVRNAALEVLTESLHGVPWQPVDLECTLEERHHYLSLRNDAEEWFATPRQARRRAAVLAMIRERDSVERFNAARDERDTAREYRERLQRLWPEIDWANLTGLFQPSWPDNRKPRKPRVKKVRPVPDGPQPRRLTFLKLTDVRPEDLANGT